MELTSYGQSFVPIAGQWTALWKRTQQLKDSDDMKVLTIAGTDSICNYTLVRLFKEHVERHPNIRLRIRTHHSYEIQGLVQNRMADEVFISWSHDYQQWHDRHWEPERHPAVAVNTGSMLQRFLDSPKRWAVAPMSVIQRLSRKGELTHYRLKTPPPPRICYELKNRHPTLGQQQPIDTFQQELEAFVATNPDICVFEGWMLDEERIREQGRRPVSGERRRRMGR